jgi:hypothetical protein
MSDGSTIRLAIGGFLGLMAAAMTLELARGAGILLPMIAMRGVGFVLGTSAIVVGNALPKVRPLALFVSDPAVVAPAERATGWLLVLTGIADAALFLLAPLPTARTASALIGMATLLVIGTTWTSTLLGRRAGDRTFAQETRRPRALMLWLLLALAYVLATASIGFLFGMSWWIVLLLWAGYTLLARALNPRCAR